MTGGVIRRKPGGSHASAVFPAVSDRLYNKVVGVPEPLVRKPLREWSRPKPRTKTSPPKYPDEVILEVRRLRETHGMSASQIALQLTVLGYPMERGRATQIFSYSTRSHLIPEPNRVEPYPIPTPAKEAT